MTADAREEMVPRRRSRLLDTLSHHDFRLLWFGLLISNLGTWMQITTLGYLVVKLAPTPGFASLYVGLLGASAAVPVLLLSPIAGVVADRFPRRRVLLITNVAIAVTALALALIASAGHVALWEILLLQSLRSAIASFDAPARQSWVPLLVPRELVGNAIGLNSVAFNAPSVIGPPIAGLLITAVGVATSFYLNAIATLAVVVALANMAPVAPSSLRRESVVRSIVAGVNFLWRHPVLKSVVVLLLSTCLLVRPYLQLLPAYAAHVLFVDARGLGLLLAASGAGAILGSVLIAVVDNRYRMRLWFASALLMPAGTIALGYSHDVRLATVVLAIEGLAVLTFTGSSNVLLQTLAPDDMRGRAISVFSMIILGLVPAGSLLLGSLASAIGLPHALIAGGALALLFTVTVMIRDPALRTV